MGAMVRSVLVIDDHAGFRRGARMLLERGPFSVVGEAADAASGLLAAKRLHPDVVLLDIVLPDSDGFAVLDVLLGVPTPPAVVLMSTRDASDYGDRVARSGAKGFIQKARLCVPALDELLR
jgi:DNA-binding NarL/FixJ family response regulator